MLINFLHPLNKKRGLWSRWFGSGRYSRVLILLSVGTRSINIELFARCRLQNCRLTTLSKRRRFQRPSSSPSIIQTDAGRESYLEPRSLGMCEGNNQGREFRMLGIAQDERKQSCQKDNWEETEVWSSKLKTVVHWQGILTKSIYFMWLHHVALDSVAFKWSSVFAFTQLHCFFFKNHFTWQHLGGRWLFGFLTEGTSRGYRKCARRQFRPGPGVGWERAMRDRILWLTGLWNR